MKIVLILSYISLCFLSYCLLEILRIYSYCRPSSIIISILTKVSILLKYVFFFSFVLDPLFNFIYRGRAAIEKDIREKTEAAQRAKLEAYKRGEYMPTLSDLDDWR